MATTAWVAVLAVTCAAVLGLSDQAETGLRTLEEPAPALDAVDKQAEKEIQGALHSPESFREIPGTPAGAIVYKTARMDSQQICSSLCNNDVDCSAYSWDLSFNECKLLKKDPEALERQTAQVRDDVMKDQGKAAEEQAAEIEGAEEKEKAKEEADMKKIENTPVSKLEKEKPSPRDQYRTAIKKEKEAKKMAKDTSTAHKEASEKSIGTQTVERVAKRHITDVGAKLKAEHKIFSAAMLNLEEQVMIRDDRKSKEVLLAQGAKEEAELKYDKIHTESLNAIRMGTKAQGMNNAAKAAEIQASQAATQAKIAAAEKLKALETAKKDYHAAEVKQKNEEDAQKRKDAAVAKSYLKMRSMTKERDARAAASSEQTFEEQDAAAKDTCLKQQQEMKKQELAIRQELSEQIGKDQRAMTEKKIKEMTEEAEAATDKKVANEEKEAVDAAKKKADASVGDLMEALGADDHLLGEVKDAASQEAKATKKEAQAEVERAKAKKASAEATAEAAEEKVKQESENVDRAKKNLESAKKSAKEAKSDAEKDAAAANVKKLEAKLAEVKGKVKQAEKASDAKAKEATDAKVSAANAEAKESKAQAAEDSANVKKEAQKAAEKKAMLEAENKATIEGAKEKAEAMQQGNEAAEALRKQTEERIVSMVEDAWQKKKAEMGFQEINCENPYKTTKEKLQDTVNQLQAEKLQPSKLPPSPYTLDPVAAKAIEKSVAAETEKAMELKLNDVAKELKEKMAAQKKKDQELIADTKAKAETRVRQAKEEATKAEAEADQSKKEAQRAEEAAEDAGPKLRDGWGMVHTRLGEPMN